MSILCLHIKSKQPFFGLPLWLSWLRICPQCWRPGFDPWVGKMPWRRERLPTPAFWPRECHGLYSPWGGLKESDITECFYTGFPGGNSGKESVCQCRSHRRCGFDPWVGKICILAWRIPWTGAWQAAVHRVTKSQT